MSFVVVVVVVVLSGAAALAANALMVACCWRSVMDVFHTAWTMMPSADVRAPSSIGTICWFCDGISTKNNSPVTRTVPPMTSPPKMVRSIG